MIVRSLAVFIGLNLLLVLGLAPPANAFPAQEPVHATMRAALVAPDSNCGHLRNSNVYVADYNAIVPQVTSYQRANTTPSRSLTTVHVSANAALDVPQYTAERAVSNHPSTANGTATVDDTANAQQANVRFGLNWAWADTAAMTNDTDTGQQPVASVGIAHDTAIDTNNASVTTARRSEGQFGWQRVWPMNVSQTDSVNAASTGQCPAVCGSIDLTVVSRK